MNRNYSGQVESQRRVLCGDKRVKRVYEEPGAGESMTCLRGKKKTTHVPNDLYRKWRGRGWLLRLWPCAGTRPWGLVTVMVRGLGCGLSAVESQSWVLREKKMIRFGCWKHLSSSTRESGLREHSSRGLEHQWGDRGSDLGKIRVVFN